MLLACWRLQSYSCVSHSKSLLEYYKGTVDKYLKFFLFALREKGEVVEGSENMKLEENVQGVLG